MKYFGPQDGNLSHGQVLDARPLKVQKTRVELKCVLSKNLQPTLNGVQTSTFVVTTCTLDVLSTPAVLITRCVAVTQSIGTVVPVYPDDSLSDTLNSILSQMLSNLPADRDPVPVVKMKNLPLWYSNETLQ